MTASAIERLLAEARATLTRIDPVEAHLRAVGGEAVVVDIRPGWQRQHEVPGSLIVERNHLEWRLHPDSDARLSAATPGVQWIVVCSEGYASSLAAASLRRIGLDATDVVGGIAAWRDAGLPLAHGPSEVESFVRATANPLSGQTVLL